MPIREPHRVTELFASKAGTKPSEERLIAICKEGEERYAKIPPGFEDAKKATEGGDKFGDLIIWKEMIEKAKADTNEAGPMALDERKVCARRH